MVLAGGRGEVLEFLELRVGQFDRVGTDVLLKARNAFGARDRRDVIALGQQPRDRDLCRCGADLRCDGCDLVGETQVVLEVLAAEAAGRNPYDKALSNLVGELSTRSDDFRTRWAAHDVRLHRTGVKKLHHPVVGDLELTYEGMELPADPGLTMFVYTAEPASASEDGLKLLASWAATEALVESEFEAHAADSGPSEAGQR